MVLFILTVLSIFTVVNFNNDGCATTEGLKGTCYHNLECRSLGGIPSGLCAAGYGICCLCEYKGRFSEPFQILKYTYIYNY